MTRTDLERIGFAVWGDRERRTLHVDVPELATRFPLHHNAPLQVLAVRALHELRARIDGVVIIAHLQGVGAS